MYLVNKYQVKDQEFSFIEVSNKYIKATFSNYGANILSIFTPDKDGLFESVLIAYDNLEAYLKNSLYLNATIGPFSGRIADSKFTLNNEEISLDSNHLETVNLHGGKESIAFKFFDYEIVEEKDVTKVVFTYQKLESESRFPGNQEYTITYIIKESTITIDFKASTDKDTLCNLTNHAYFNLSGNLKRDVLKHSLYVNSSKSLALDEKFAPKGVISSLGTHLDFKDSKLIEDNFFEGIYQLPEKGIDNPMLLDDIGISYIQVQLHDPVSKRNLEVYTSYPCIVVYTHNHLDDNQFLFKAENRLHMGICFEAQFEPNGINVNGLNDSILRKGEIYSHQTIFKFSVKE